MRAACAVGVLACVLGGAAGARAAWTAYLRGPAHSSYDGTLTAITPANASTLALAWRFKGDPPTQAGQPGPRFYSTPTVWGNTLFVGAGTGVFYALDVATGHVLWKRFLGFRPHLTCSALGFVATATVAPDPTTAQPTVYVAAPDGYLYAMDAADGHDVWPPATIKLPSSTANDYFDWSSPTVANGRIYVGVASQCDNPLVRGALKAYDQATGERIATYFAVPSGTTGGGIWTSAAVGPSGSVFVTTGNEGSSSSPGDSLAIVQLNGTTLARQGRWMISAAAFGRDRDFSSSPTLFTARLGSSDKPTSLVGACNKTGIFYTLRRGDLAAGPVWSLRLQTTGYPCLPAAVWDGPHLFLSSSAATTIDGVEYPGAVRAVTTASGASLWERGFPAPIAGTPALNGSDVLAVATYDTTSGDPNAAYLLDASSGDVLATLAVGDGAGFPQPVFVGTTLLLAGFKGIYAYRLPGSGTGAR